MENTSFSKKLKARLEVEKLEPQSQKYKILKHLLAGHTITSMEALGRFGCFRLADVIYKLRGEGYNIKTELIDNYNNSGQHARYTLIQKK